MNQDRHERRCTAGEVFLVFLKLGLTSFGGPIAHLGYFRDEIVSRRRWIDETGYADLVALCQFLPGPASSQVGFALGLHRAGWLGALAAWCGFTLPSAIVLVLFALTAAAFDGPLAQGVLHGLKLVAVAVVAQAVWGMARTLTPDLQRAGIALVAIVIVVVLAGSAGQVLAIAVGGLAGLWLCRGAAQKVDAAMMFPVTAGAGITCLLIFAVLLLGLPVLATVSEHAMDLFDAFFRAGALVFGGGHVVLPLLDAETVTTGWVSRDDFLAGYGATQAMPGPLFTFAAYLGAAGTLAPNGVPGALIALVAIFLPGMLLLVGALPFWDALRRRSWAQAGMRGANAAVVGILAAAFFDPVWRSAVLTPLDAVLALAGFAALVFGKAPPWLIVVAMALIGAGRGLLQL